MACGDRGLGSKMMLHAFMFHPATPSAALDESVNAVGCDSFSWQTDLSVQLYSSLVLVLLRTLGIRE